MKILRNLTIATLVAAAACGGGGESNSVTNPTGGNPTGGNPTGGSDTPTATNAVSVADNIFTPANIVVAVGTTVTWTWSPNVTTHNVVFGDGSKSADQATGTFSRIFSTAGTFNYSCTLHSGMNGSVKVQ
jgi:plastocyanin